MKPKRSPWQIVGVLLIVLLLVSLITGGVGVSWYNAENPPVAQKPYYRQPGWNNGQIAPLGQPGNGFGQPGVEAEPASTQSIRTLFTGFAAALQQKNTAPEPWLDSLAILSRALAIAPPGLAYPTQQDGKIAFHADGESRAFTQALRTSRPTWRSWNWDAFTLHRVNEVGLVPDAFEAFTSFPKPDGARIKIRWTLSRRAFDGTYAITGWTDLGTGIGSDFEVALSMISHSTGAGLDRLLLNLRSLPDAHRALDERRFDDARKHLDTAARARPRGEFGDVYELVEARFDLLSGIGNEGVSPVDRLDALLFENPANLPALMLQIRAMADDRQFEAIADLARRYQDIAGPDADALAWSGLAEAEQERPDEARDLFEQALKLDPSQATAIVGLLELMTDADKVAFVDRLAGRKTFRGLFHRLMDNTALEDPKTTELLARAHRRGFPDDHSAARHLVRALMMRDQFAAAIEVFQKSIAELADEPREKLLSEFLESSTSKKRQREAYDAVPAGDREEAFRSVMRSWSYWLIDSDDVEPEQAAQRNAIREKYATLLELHEKTRADDDWVLIYRAKEANRSGPHRG